MEFFITDNQNLKKMNGLIVVIDVLRAFTTACYAANNNPKDYIIVDDLNLAYKLKRGNQDRVLLGERDGLNLPGFNYGNSPFEIKNMDFSNKTIVHTTTLGTQGIVNALNYADKVITGSFVNAKAVINYIKKEKPKKISLFCTDSSSKDNEDTTFAKYIKGYFENKPLNFNDIKEHLVNHESGRRYLINPRTKYSKKDFFLALKLNKFNFVLKAYLDKEGLVHLKKITL